MTLGDVLWVWQAHEHRGWSTITTFIPLLGQHGPLMSRNPSIARGMGDVARQHGEHYFMEVRLARFELQEVEDLHRPINVVPSVD